MCSYYSRIRSPSFFFLPALLHYFTPRPQSSPLPPPPTTQDKVLLYTIYVAGKNDIEVQRKGLVAIIWVGANNSDCTNNSVTSSLSKNTKQRDLVKHILLGTSNKSFHKTVSIRFIGYHICTPNSSAYKLLGSIIAMAIHKKNRSKLRIHSGKALTIVHSCTVRLPSDYSSLPFSLFLSLTHTLIHTLSVVLTGCIKWVAMFCCSVPFIVLVSCRVVS